MPLAGPSTRGNRSSRWAQRAPQQVAGHNTQDQAARADDSEMQRAPDNPSWERLRSAQEIGLGLVLKEDFTSDTLKCFTVYR